LKEITVVSFVKFNKSQLDKLRAISPSLVVHQFTDQSIDELPPALVNNAQILYGWGNAVADAHKLPNLKWIQTHSAGVDNLLDKPVWQSEVIISSMNGIHAVPIAEHALAMMLAFRWSLAKMFHFKANAAWPSGRWDHFVKPELRGSTLGIVGYGAIGRELARQAQGLGMQILTANHSGRRSPFTGYSEPGVGDPQATIPETIYPSDQLLTMLPRCDYVVALVPLTPNTRHLFNQQAFAAMKPSAFFFNLGRGPVVDESALIDALNQQTVAGAGLDVFETEPLPANSPLWQLDNLIISPHVSGFSPKYDDRASNLFAENLERYLNNKPLLNLVEREKGY